MLNPKLLLPLRASVSLSASDCANVELTRIKVKHDFGSLGALQELWGVNSEQPT